MPQDPFRRDAGPSSDAAQTALVEQGPVSHRLGRALVGEEAQDTDRLFGFIASDDRRAFDDQQALVFGEAAANRLDPETANARYGVEGYLSFDRPVNAHRAAEMHRQAQLRRFREQTAARADLSGLETLGASLVGSATDPVMLPTWFIGGGGAALRALRVAPAATRLGAVARGAAVGAIDGLTGGVAAEGLNAAARIGAGEEYDFGDAARNVLFGTALGAGVGGTVGGVTHRAPRAGGAVADRIRFEAEARGENAETAVRIAQLESGLNPAAANPRSRARGLFQFMPGTWAKMGGGDRLDPVLSARNGVRLMAQNREALARQLGRPAAEWELYLAHQQGAGGAAALLRNPGRLAVDVLREIGVRNPLDAIRLNGGDAATTAGDFVRHWRDRFGATGPSIEALAPEPLPRVLAPLTDNERLGGFAEAVEAMADDAPVDLGASLARGGLEALDEVSAAPSIRGRWLETDVAVARDGSEIPVRFALVELDDLKTSHTDDLSPEPAYPVALQPRDRTRAGSQAENYALERDLNPALLMKDKAAAGGAPIVSPDGVVESGNGRTIAVRRSARTGTEAWRRYTAELARQGFDTSGFDRPVLVRMRTEPLRGEQRAAMAAALNRSPTEAYSPVEQARGDARRLDAAMLGLIEGDDAFSASNRPFVRAFVQRAAPGDANALTDARGALSLGGRQRVEAALVQAAYGDDRLTAALFEQADPTIRGIGRALADAAAAWARMRAEAPKGLDLTANLTAAVETVREARARRISVGEWLDGRLGQGGLFGGEAISPETEAFVRLMFRDPGLTKPRGAERLAEALRDYARSAAETPAGPDLFGETPDGRAFLETLRARYDLAEGEGRSGLAWAGGDEPAWTTRETEAAVLDLRPAGRVGDGPGRGGERPGDGDGAGGSGEPDGARARLTAQARVEAFIVGEPELRALVEDTEALARQAGIEPPPFEKSTEPSTVAEAIRAAAFCLTTENVVSSVIR